MIGVIIVAHGPLAKALRGAAEFIVGGRMDQLESLTVGPESTPESLKEALEEAIAKVDDGDGAIILVDMFGGSPSDMAMSFLKPGHLEVLTGVNLPMLIETLTQRQRDYPLAKLAAMIEERTREAIVHASRMLSPE